MKIRTNGAEPFILANKPHLFVTVLAEPTLKAHLHPAPLQPGTLFSPVLFFPCLLVLFFRQLSRQLFTRFLVLLRPTGLFEALRS